METDEKINSNEENLNKEDENILEDLDYEDEVTKLEEPIFAKEQVKQKEFFYHKQNSWKFLSLIFVVALSGVLVGVGITSTYLSQIKPPYKYENPTYEIIGKVYEEESIIIDTISKVKEAVVSVRTVRMQESFFFQAIPTEGVASGVIISPQGLVVTNNHVVEGATEIEIVTLEGSNYKVEVVGTDPTSDIAILRIKTEENKTFPYLSWGDSNKIKVGQRVIAIGNPYGLSHTVTTGVVSATDRSIETDKGRIIVGLIQTDAAINPGNSGGPLLDLEGNIIGINTAIVQGAQGLGFSASSNVARKVLEDILAYGEPIWPWLGIAGVNVTSELVKNEGLTINYGIIIRRVELDTPAHQAGIKVGDIITAINNKKITNMYELTSVIRSYRIGDTVSVEIYRKTGEVLTLSVTLAKRRI